MEKKEIKVLEEKALDIRCSTIDCIGYLGIGHVGGCMTLVELLSVLYFKHMNVNINDPLWEERDRLVLSKGHAGPVLYATLAEKGFFNKELLHTLNVGGTNLPSHCDRTKTVGIDMTTGSLGQGLSVACGIAFANRIDHRENYVYCVIGDGESNEGQNWEAAMFAAHNKLGKLIAFTDYNQMQIDGTTDEVLTLGDIEGKWKTFGWNVERVDGHDIEALCTAIDKAKANSKEINPKPNMIILDTVKGKGVESAEGKVTSHNMPLTSDYAKEAINKLRGNSRA